MIAGGGGRTRRTGVRVRVLATLAISLLCGIFFIAVELFYSSLTQRRVGAAVVKDCKTLDPVRHHAFETNCTATRFWGLEHYAFTTNSLGFRDRAVRTVAPSIDRPRILLLGDSFTEGLLSWADSYAGRIAATLPQYEILNGGVSSYSPSNYLNTARWLLDQRIGFDEVIVFPDVSDIQDEAAYYKDADDSGRVSAPDHWQLKSGWAMDMRERVQRRLVLTNYPLDLFEGWLIRRGIYVKRTDAPGDNLFDTERVAWTYRAVSNEPFMSGYGSSGMAGGIEKALRKMSALHDELQRRGIPLRVVVFPWPSQVVHDTPDSRGVQIWREWCRGRCRDFGSTYPAFFAAKDACPRYAPGCWYRDLFVPGDSHFNAKGNAVIADAVVAMLRRAPPAKALGSE